ncbi:MAG TPA: peptidylprolyl isomerase [Bacteroidales bacterium]|nr:peptidylprolyl isomerase [Bacteroidales bacterium]
MKLKIGIVLCFFIQITAVAQTDKNVIDEIIGTVGNRIILKSDLEYALQGYKYQMGLFTLENEDELRCAILEQLIFQKLLVNQAELDSIVVTDAQINERIDYNMRMQIAQMGGNIKKLEEAYGKTLSEIKIDSRDLVKDEFLIDQMQYKLTQNINITYQEVKEYFESIPYDSLPVIPLEYELSQIVKTPIISEIEKIEVKNRLEEIRSRVLRGESFKTFARLYSEDPASAAKGGEIGFVSRGELFSEFELAAFTLRPGEISPVVETQAGFHIIQMIERRGDQINVAHILIKPKPSAEEMMQSKNYLDSIYKILKDTKMPFDSAAMRYSDDPSKINGGVIVNTYNLSYTFTEDQLDKSILYAINNLIAGEFSQVVPMITDDGNQAYRIIYVKAKHAAHKANLIDDYEKIKNVALEQKKQKALLKWAINKVKITHIKVKEQYQDCDFFEKFGIITK